MKYRDRQRAKRIKAHIAAVTCLFLGFSCAFIGYMFLGYMDPIAANLHEQPELIGALGCIAAFASFVSFLFVPLIYADAVEVF